VKVLHYVGYPLAWARGGHAVQIHQTIAALEKLGVQNEWLDHARPDRQPGDLLQYWTRPPSDFHWQLARAQGLRLVIQELHGPGASRPSWFWKIRRAQRRALRSLLGANLYGHFGAGIYQHCAAAVAVTPLEAAYMIQVFDAPRARVHFIPNGVDDVFFDDSVAPCVFDGLVYLGHICPRKNSLAVARAAKQARMAIQFVGDAPVAQDDYFRAFQAEVDNQYVFWKGAISDRKSIAALLRGCRGVLLTSRHESNPLSLLEALACGKPVMAPDLPPLRSFYKDAVLFAPAPEDGRFIPLLKRFDAMCRRDYRQTFPVLSWTAVARRYADIYAAIMSGPAG